MHILLVNDDGPPSNSSSPYVHSLVSTLQSAGHKVSVVLPHIQRSWIGKAHIVGQTLTPTYFRPGNLLEDDGTTSERPFEDGKEEWILIDGTPASCVQIGLHHVFKDREPIDLVLSGPNYGRNTTAVFALSSGTIGGAMEGSQNGMKSIALSFAFDSREHDLDVISEASQLSTRLVEKLYKDWPQDVDLYSINVPLRKGVSNNRIVYTQMIQNQWSSGSSFKAMPEDADDADPDIEEYKIRKSEQTNGQTSNGTVKQGHCTYKWAPNFADVKKAVEDAGSGDGWEVTQGNVSVTPLKASFWHLPHYKGEIKLDEKLEQASQPSNTLTAIYAYIDYPDDYVQPLILRALQNLPNISFESGRTLDELRTSQRSLQISAYEQLDFEQALQHPSDSLICAYVIRKALIRKHYLSNTISSRLVKHPGTPLASHFKLCVHFEVDYAEFLDEALVDAWDLNESMTRNGALGEGDERQWWILKPGMSDGGNGLRLFSSLEELQSIFEEWDEDEEDEDQSSDSCGAMATNVSQTEQDRTGGTLTSQLRHFVAQPYIERPLLLESYNNKKFHLRVYVLAVGALKVYVYSEMLALFAAKSYSPPTHQTDGIDLSQHLTNTCFQDEATRATSVHRFSTLQSPGLPTDWQKQVYEQVCDVTGEIFEAAAREQMIHFQTIPNAFEIFGVDFLVDADLNVWLLELNAYPDFKQTGKELQDAVVGGLFEEVVNVAAVPFFDKSSSEARRGTERMVLVRDIDLGRN